MPKPKPMKLWRSIVRLYLKVKSIRKVSGISGMSRTGVEYVLREMGTKKFPRTRCGDESSSRKSIPEGPRKQIRTYKIMKKLYIDQKMSAVEIGKLMHLDPTTVYGGLRQCGIKIRSIRESLSGKPRPSMYGAKNHAWRGGITFWRRRARKRLNVSFVRPVMERDGFACRWCMSKKNIVVHHDKREFCHIVRIIKRRKKFSNEEEFIDQIVKEHRLSDGITLCKECHDCLHQMQINLKRFFGAL